MARNRTTSKSKPRRRQAAPLFSPSELAEGRPRSDGRPRARTPTAPPPSISPAWELRVGQVLGGRWRLVKRLGEGGMGSVWEAEQVHTGRRAAVKVLSHALAQDPRQRAYFLREGRTANAVDAVRAVPATGPGVVPVYDDGETPTGAPFLVMEELEGMPLDAFVAKSKRLPPATVANVVYDAARALEPAHAQGVVHRDLKPENLFWTRAGDLRVLDFGLAQEPGDPSTAGSFVGTRGYAPPEQAIGLRAGPQADVYGLGATAYQLLTGQVPMPAEGQLHAAAAYLAKLPRSQRQRVLAEQVRPNLDAYPGCPVPPVRSLAPHVPPGLARVVDTALQCDETRRYPSLVALRKDLERAVQEELARNQPSQATRSKVG